MIAIVQARFSSQRLPGKVLRPIGGRPMLAWVVAQVKRARAVDHVVVATSVDPSDDPVAAFCEQAMVSVFRGPLDDVAERMLGAAEMFRAEAFVRISGDSPLMDPAVIDRVVALFEVADADLATNVGRRTFPKGVSVEVVRARSLRKAIPLMNPGEIEHVTPVFYRRPDVFKVANLESGHAWGAVQLSVDTEQDFMLVDRMMAELPRGAEIPGVDELVALKTRIAGHC